jgi:hypothetical protein
MACMPFNCFHCGEIIGGTNGPPVWQGDNGLLYCSKCAFRFRVNPIRVLAKQYNKKVRDYKQFLNAR